MKILDKFMQVGGHRMQLMFYNDNSFEFRMMPITDASLVEKEGNDIHKAWPSFNKLLMPFKGLGKIQRQSILMSCENDIIFDPFDKLEPGEKPEKGGGLVKDWIKNKAESVRYRHQSHPGDEPILNKIILFLGIGLTVEILVWAFMAVSTYMASRGGG